MRKNNNCINLRAFLLSTDKILQITSTDFSAQMFMNGIKHVNTIIKHIKYKTRSLKGVLVETWRTWTSKIPSRKSSSAFNFGSFQELRQRKPASKRDGQNHRRK